MDTEELKAKIQEKMRDFGIVSEIEVPEPGLTYVFNLLLTNVDLPNLNKNGAPKHPYVQSCERALRVSLGKMGFPPKTLQESYLQRKDNSSDYYLRCILNKTLMDKSELVSESARSS